MVDIFRPDNALDTAKLFLNWDGMGKLMLERYLYKIFRFPTSGESASHHFLETLKSHFALVSSKS